MPLNPKEREREREKGLEALYIIDEIRSIYIYIQLQLHNNY